MVGGSKYKFYSVWLKQTKVIEYEKYVRTGGHSKNKYPFAGRRGM